MELCQPKTHFVTVAGEGHLNRAAERLHISQLSTSAHIKALEGEVVAIDKVEGVVAGSGSELLSQPVSAGQQPHHVRQPAAAG